MLSGGHIPEARGAIVARRHDTGTIRAQPRLRDGSIVAIHPHQAGHLPPSIGKTQAVGRGTRGMSAVQFQRLGKPKQGQAVIVIVESTRAIGHVLAGQLTAHGVALGHGIVLGVFLTGCQLVKIDGGEERADRAHDEHEDQGRAQAGDAGMTAAPAPAAFKPAHRTRQDRLAPQIPL